MSCKRIPLIVLIAILPALSYPQKLPSKKRILKSMQLTNQYFMNKWPDPGKTIITNKERQSNIWTRGVYYEGLIALYETDPQKKYYDYAVDWGEKHQWGLVGGNATRNADNQDCGQIYIDLWWRDKDFMPPYKEPNGQDCYWSRGNGWVLAALARTLSWLPESDPHYEEYLNDFKNMAQALLPLQREDGFWNVSLHDATHFGGKETSGTALFAYGLAWGVNKGILDQKIYRPIAIKAWNAMVKDAVHPDGKLGYVQGTGKEPQGRPTGYLRQYS